MSFVFLLVPPIHNLFVPHSFSSATFNLIPHQQKAIMNQVIRFSPPFIVQL